MPIIKAKNLKELRVAAKRFVASLRGSEIVGLIGPLGAGKTTFVKMVAKELGIKKTIVSPTFTLLQSYALRVTRYGLRFLVHIDCYRLPKKNPQAVWKQLLAAGLEDWLNRPDALVMIEWADRLPKNIQSKIKTIKIDRSISRDGKPSGQKS